MGGPTFQEYDYMYYGSASYGPGHDDTHSSNHNNNNKGYNSNNDNYQDSNDYSIDSGLVDYPDTDYHQSSSHNYVDYQGSSQSGYNNDNTNENNYENDFNYQEEPLYVDTVEYPVDSGLVTLDYQFEDETEDYSDTNYPEYSSNNDVDYPSSNEDYSNDDSVEEYQDTDYDQSTSNSYGDYQSSSSSDTSYNYGDQVCSLYCVMFSRLYSNETILKTSTPFPFLRKSPTLCRNDLE